MYTKKLNKYFSINRRFLLNFKFFGNDVNEISKGKLDMF